MGGRGPWATGIWWGERACEVEVWNREGLGYYGVEVRDRWGLQLKEAVGSVRVK